MYFDFETYWDAFKDLSAAKGLWFNRNLLGKILLCPLFAITIFFSFFLIAITFVACEGLNLIAVLIVFINKITSSK